MPIPAKPAKAAPAPIGRQASVLDHAALFEIWLNKQVATGRLSAKQAKDYWNRHGHETLDFIKSKIPILGDLVDTGKTIVAVIRDLGLAGEYYIKTYGQKQYIIFKGSSAARKLLTGTRYGVNHAKVVEMQLGRAGIRAAARESFIFGMIFCTVIDVVDYVSRDNGTLTELFGTIAVDLGKCLIASGAAVAAGVATAALMGTAVIALGPIVVALAVGIGVSLALDAIDNRFKITQRLGKLLEDGLETLEKAAHALMQQSARAWNEFVTTHRMIDLRHEAEEVARRFRQEVDTMRWFYRSFL